MLNQSTLTTYVRVLYFPQIIRGTVEALGDLWIVQWLLGLSVVRRIANKLKRAGARGSRQEHTPSGASHPSSSFDGASSTMFSDRYSDQQYMHAENCLKIIEAMSAKETLHRLLHCDSSDPYKILGVNHAATQAQVKKAYVGVNVPEMGRIYS
eukprot:m.464064 g.464064  ORF g.464064 m.464064 type:complete len:153 (+) comp21614_c0_seq2:659-1117(+)